MNSNIRDFIKAIQNANKTATSAYDTAARVTRVEGGTAWVHVEGGVEETPVEMSISCEPGDDVRVRINKGAAYIIGNNTNPPTNDRIIVKYAADLAQAAREVANRAYENLQEVLSTYVTRGSSNIPTLSDVMTKEDDAVSVYYRDVFKKSENPSDYSDTGHKLLKMNKDGLNLSETTRDYSAGYPNYELVEVPIIHIGSDYILNSAIELHGFKSVFFGYNGWAKGDYSFGVSSGQADGHYSAAVNEGRVKTYKHDDYDRTYPNTIGKYSFSANDSHNMGNYSTGLNHSTIWDGSLDCVAEGTSTIKGGKQNHAEGVDTSAGNGYGSGSILCVNGAHSEGEKTQARAQAGHSEGYGSEVGFSAGFGCHAGGFFTLVNQTGVFGKTVVGILNEDKSDTIFEVGNGYRNGSDIPNSRSDSGLVISNGFEVTLSGMIQTGYGSPARIAFGSVNNYYGWYDSNGSFSPWAFLVNGKVPESLLPSYVDDVIEGYYYNGSFYEDDQYQTLITPERGKIYISLDADKSYRWGGSVYVELTSGGVVYTAGDGIDISPTNEISVNDDIARVADIPTVPTNVSAFVNDAGYLTQHQDLSNYIQKSLTAGLVKNDGTIDTTAYATASALAGFLPLAGGTMAGAINSQHIVPATDDSYRLGSSASKYNSAYVKRIYNLASIESTTDGSKRLLVPAKSGTIAVNEDLPEVVGNLIAVTPILESGVLIANVTVNGVPKNLYAPSGGSSYTAGDGIDISNNVISADNTIARVSALSSYLPIAGGTISGSLEVENDLEIDGDFVANGNADIAGDLELSGDLIVENIINSGGVSVNGAGFVRENNVSTISTDVVVTNVIEAADVRFGSSPNEEVLIDSAGDLSGGSVDTTPTSGSKHIVTSGGVASALAGKQDALTAGAGLEISNAIVKTNITANDDWQDTAYEKGAGVFAHKYENANTTTYNLPSGFCFVIVYRYSSNRGVAYATYWASGGGSPKTWVNALHDDTAPYNWTGWKQMYTPETIGGATTPTYLNAGVPTACSAYAGGTKVTLNDLNKGASTASFYAPTSAGTLGYFLKSSGSGAPTWAAIPSGGGGLSMDGIYLSNTEYKQPLVNSPCFDCVLPINTKITSVSALITYINQYGFIPIRVIGFYSGAAAGYHNTPLVELLGTNHNQNGILLGGQGYAGKGSGTWDGNFQGFYVFQLSSENTTSLADTVSNYGTGLYKHHFKITFKGNSAQIGMRIH